MASSPATTCRDGPTPRRASSPSATSTPAKARPSPVTSGRKPAPMPPPCSPSTDFVDVASTVETHRPLVELALGHGALRRFVEKPFAQTWPDGLAMVEGQAEHADSQLIVHGASAGSGRCRCCACSSTAARSARPSSRASRSAMAAMSTQTSPVRRGRGLRPDGHRAAPLRRRTVSVRRRWPSFTLVTRLNAVLRARTPSARHARHASSTVSTSSTASTSRTVPDPFPRPRAHRGTKGAIELTPRRTSSRAPRWRGPRDRQRSAGPGLGEHLAPHAQERSRRLARRRRAAPGRAEPRPSARADLAAASPWRWPPAGPPRATRSLTSTTSPPEAGAVTGSEDRCSDRDRLAGWQRPRGDRRRPSFTSTFLPIAPARRRNFRALHRPRGAELTEIFGPVPGPSLPAPPRGNRPPLAGARRPVPGRSRRRGAVATREYGTRVGRRSSFELEDGSRGCVSSTLRLPQDVGRRRPGPQLVEDLKQLNRIAPPLIGSHRRALGRARRRGDGGRLVAELLDRLDFVKDDDLQQQCVLPVEEERHRHDGDVIEWSATGAAEAVLHLQRHPARSTMRAPRPRPGAQQHLRHGGP